MKLGAANSCCSLCLIQEVSCKLVNPLSRAPLRLRCSKAVRAKCFLMCKCDDGSCLDGLGCDTCTLELGQQHQTLPFQHRFHGEPLDARPLPFQHCGGGPQLLESQCVSQCFHIVIITPLSVRQLYGTERSETGCLLRCGAFDLAFPVTNPLIPMLSPGSSLWLANTPPQSWKPAQCPDRVAPFLEKLNCWN